MQQTVLAIMWFSAVWMTQPQLGRIGDQAVIYRVSLYFGAQGRLKRLK
jgi:hypothetical protein